MPLVTSDIRVPTSDIPLPPLSPPDQALVLSLILSDFDLLHAASETRIPPTDILALTTRPDIAAYLTAHRALTHARLEHLALATLERLLTPPPHPTKQLDHHNTESRRSATTILRAITQARLQLTPTSPTRQRGFSPRSRAQAPEPHATTNSPSAPTPPDSHPSHDSHDSHDSHESYHPHPPSPTPPPRPQPPTPNLSHSPPRTPDTPSMRHHTAAALLLALSITALAPQRAHAQSIELIPPPTGRQFALPTAISADGSVIVGSSGIPGPFDEDCHAFRWTESTGIQDLGLLPGTQESWVLAISADTSTIVGVCRGPSDDYRFRATIWQAGRIAPLPLLPDACENAPKAISADGGVIVGYTGFLCESTAYSYRATMWSRYLGVVDLNTHLPSIGVDLTGWVLLFASGVSADGRIIIGQGYYNNALHGFILTLPPPCGAADFNNDGDTGTDADIEAFFACLGGHCCPRCPEAGADFNADGDTGTDQDIEAFFRVLGGGTC
ncbi:MAG TPA: hypothetical protein VD997_13500 [Phycisphaerales bacterium]|nr:hypothetical protein [Phycisphaerales bacterium]